MEMQLALAGSSVLYHLIPMEYAIEAMQKDRFRLMPTNEGVEAEFGDAQYFLSLARSKLSDYFIKEAGAMHVIFVLDGQKMNANYQIKAVDYWASQKHVSNDEKEDRLFADKMFIPCVRYIKEIHFMKESGKYKENESLTLALLAKRNKIDLFQYDEHKAFVRLDKRKVIKLEVSNIKKKKFGKNEWTPGPDYTLEAWYVASQIVFKGATPHYTQFMAGAKHKEQRKARERVARDIRNLIKYRDVEEKPVRDFNQLTGFLKDPYDAAFLEKIKRVKRRLKTNTKGFLDFVRKRWMTQEEKEMHGLE